MKPRRRDPADTILAVAFAFGGGLSAWIGYAGWNGLWWWFLSVLSAFVLGAEYSRGRLT